MYGSRRNGHLFIPDLYLRGVRNFIVYQSTDIADYPDANFILVKDSLAALQQIAAFHRRQFDMPVIGITGSNGKTIVKEWLNQLLEDRFQIVRSPRSYNSQIGVPLSIWQMNERHNLALIEAGISKSGEMRSLEEIIKPGIGVFTNIGEAHDQGFENRHLKILEKLDLFKHSIALIYSSDNPDLQNSMLAWHFGNPAPHLVSIGKEKDSTVRILKIDKQRDKTTVELEHQDSKLHLEIGFEDDASVQNALTAVGVMLYLDIPKNEIQDRLNRLNPLNMRMELKTGINHSSVINDSYSADLSSLKMALDFLSGQKQHRRRTLILSDILETGRPPKSLYTEVATLLRKYPIDRLIGVGEQLSGAALLLNDSGVKDRIFFSGTEALLEALPTLEFRDETILLKGARVFGFERVDQFLSLQVHETMLEVNLEAMVSDDKSMPPIMRIRLSPTTTTPSADICWPIPAMFETVRKTGLTTAPTTSSSTRTGSSATSRSTPTLRPRIAPARPCLRAGSAPATWRAGSWLRPRLSGVAFEIIALPPRCAVLAVAVLVSPSVATISWSRSNGGSLNSVNTSPRTSTMTRSQITRSESSSLHSSTPAPVCPATLASESSKSALDATSTPRVGVIATIRPGSWASVRATVTFCWLPPDSSRTGWPGPAETSDSAEVIGAGGGSPARWPQQPEPVGQAVGDGHRGVLGHAKMRHEALGPAVLRDVADPGPLADVTVARPGTARPCSKISPAVMRLGAGDNPPEGRDPRAQQAGHAHYLAGPDPQRDAREPARAELAVRFSTVRTAVARRRGRRAGGPAGGATAADPSGADHGGDQVLLAQARGRRGEH